jgi:hypothetical protein|uniref:Uncharacterized protein n=1 Tax=Tectiviridae sp. TaxID=2831614 RepID=A0A8S5VUC2_9VIRU|nr:MAG TPA: hypothetical protein [Tectiviridae sp.]
MKKEKIIKSIREQYENNMFEDEEYYYGYAVFQTENAFYTVSDCYFGSEKQYRILVESADFSESYRLETLEDVAYFLSKEGVEL